MAKLIPKRAGLGLLIAIATAAGCGGGGSSSTGPTGGGGGVDTSSCVQAAVLCVDDTPGAGQEYASLQAAVDAVQPGQTVLVYDGDYAGAYINKSGSAGARIVIRAYADGANIVLPNATTSDGIRLQNASYVTVEGFVLRGRAANGTQVIADRCIAARGADADNPMAGNILRDNHCTDGGTECFYLSQFGNSVIEGNSILRCGRTSGTRSHGLYLANAGSDNTEIKNNRISAGLDAGAESNGIHLNGDLSIGGDGLITGVTFDGNTIYDNVQNGINMDGVRDTTLRNNLIYNNARNAVRAYAADGANGPANLMIANNTLLSGTGSGWAIKLSEDDGGHTIFNNILRGTSGSLSVENTAFTSDYNATDDKMSYDGDASTVTLAQWQAYFAGARDSQSIVATPSALFVAGGYQLSATSPARNAGVATLNGVAAPSADLAGTARPQGSAHDLGAYEAAP